MIVHQSHQQQLNGNKNIKREFTISIITCSQCNYLFKSVLPFCARCGKENIYEPQEVEKILSNKQKDNEETNDLTSMIIDQDNLNSSESTKKDKKTLILSFFKSSKLLILLYFLSFLIFGMGILIFFIPNIIHYLFVIILGFIVIFTPLMISIKFSKKPSTCQFTYEDD